MGLKAVGGQRKAKKPTKAQIQDEYMKAIQGLQMQAQMTAGLLRQVMGGQQRMDMDIGNAMGILNDIQYRTLAMIELSGVDKDALNKKADELKLEDFNNASEKEDAAKNLLPAEEVALETTVTITSTTPDVEEDEGKGIFRSKFRVGASGQPLVEKALMGKKVGDVVECEINKIKHMVEIVAIRKDGPKTENEKKPTDDKTE